MIAFLALWNDIDLQDTLAYDRWHTREHVPERVAVRGFRGARRYVAQARRSHRYFTLYELDTLDALDHAEYRDLVTHPTSASASMRPHFRNTVRAPCRTIGSWGEGIAGALAILCYSGTPEADAASEALAEDPDVVAYHLGSALPEAAAPAWISAAGSGGHRHFDRVLLVDALDRPAAARVLGRLRSGPGMAAEAPDFGNDIYDLAFIFPGHDPAARARHRRPSWRA